MKECFSWILVLLFCQNRFTQNFVQARVRNKGGGYSEFEPIHTGSEDEGFCRKATLFYFFFTFYKFNSTKHLQKTFIEEETASQFSVDRRTVSSSSTGSANSQMVLDR